MAGSAVEHEPFHAREEWLPAKPVRSPKRHASATRRDREDLLPHRGRCSRSASIRQLRVAHASHEIPDDERSADERDRRQPTRDGETDRDPEDRGALPLGWSIHQSAANSAHVVIAVAAISVVASPACARMFGLLTRRTIAAAPRRLRTAAAPRAKRRARESGRTPKLAVARAGECIDVTRSRTEYGGAFVVDRGSAGTAGAMQIGADRRRDSSERRMLEVVVVPVGCQPLHAGGQMSRLVDRSAECARGACYRERREHDETERGELERPRSRG